MWMSLRGVVTLRAFARPDSKLGSEPCAHQIHHREPHRLSHVARTIPRLKDTYAVTEIGSQIGDEDLVEFFIRRLSEGIGNTAAFYPKPVIVRIRDFKTNESARPIGGREFERKSKTDAGFSRGLTLLRLTICGRLRS